MSTLTYHLEKGKKTTTKPSLKDFYVYLKEDKAKLIVATVCILLNSAINMLTPFLIGKAVDQYISVGNMQGLLTIVYVLSVAYVVTLVAGYFQGLLIGKISQNALYRLRVSLFTKLQTLPIAFFNQNKSGDLMSRINNDTEKINTFLSQSISQFIGIVFSVLGIIVFSLLMNVKLTLVMMSATIFLYIITRILTPWIARENKKNLETVGSFSASLQENLTNFRVVAAYSKRDYLQTHLETANKDTFKSSLSAGVGNRIFEPVYDFGGSIGLICVLSYGLHLVGTGEITLGILIAFVAYTQKFFDPLRYLATIFGALQQATAAWARVQQVFSLKSNVQTDMRKENAFDNAVDSQAKPNLRLELKDVSFAYEGGGVVIENANLAFEPGKTYALVGPTGGGKSTLVNIMSHLYDPTEGKVYLNSRDIREYSDADRAKQISVILQDPILFNGTVSENITYGNDAFIDITADALTKELVEKGFKDVISRFESGLTTPVSQNGSGLSLGQKQLISFMRAILREPKLLILDEATANIDTVTETILNKTLDALPKDTTKVIIAHRLNTIKEADEIMFVNGHHVTPAGSYEDAISLITNAKRSS